MGEFIDNLQKLQQEATKLKLAVEADCCRRTSEVARLWTRIDEFAAKFADEIVRPMPSVAERGEEFADAPAMEDATFAAMRKSARSGQDLIRRMGAQSALIRVIRNAVLEKRQRLVALKKRIASGESGEAEVAVAQSRLKFVEDGIRALMLRLYVVTKDFAQSRKTLMSRIVALTTEVSEMLPKDDDKVKICFCGTSADIDNSLRLLGEMEATLKAGDRRGVASAAFGGRAKL